MDELIDQLIEVPARSRRLYPPNRSDGLEPIALQILACLARDGQLNAPELAQTLELNASTARHALGVLRDRELVTVADDPEDRRRRPHVITALGGQLVCEHMQRLGGDA